MGAPSNVERLRVPTPEEALIYQRTTATDNTHSVIREGGESLRMLPHCLLRAFECEAWRERRTPNGAAVENRDFVEWVTAPYPRGLGATLDIVEAILTSSREVAEAQQARLLWDRAVRGEPGRPTKAETVDNVHGFERPAGNSAAAGLRRLDKEAEAGNSIAAQALEAVKSGTKSIHRAMVECGFRKTLDPEVKALAARDCAEAIVALSEGDFERLTAVENLLRKAGAKNVADQIANLVDPAVMSGGRV